MTYQERHARELRTYHEWIKLGYSISTGQFNKIRYRLHDGDVSVPLYERSQVVSSFDGVVREIPAPVDYGADGPSI